jgi:hypothetical protein
MTALRLVPTTLILCLVLAACSSNRGQEEPRPQGEVGARVDSAADRLAKDTLPDTSSVPDTSTSR